MTLILGLWSGNEALIYLDTDKHALGIDVTDAQHHNFAAAVRKAAPRAMDATMYGLGAILNASAQKNAPTIFKNAGYASAWVARSRVAPRA